MCFIKSLPVWWYRIFWGFIVPKVVTEEKVQYLKVFVGMLESHDATIPYEASSVAAHNLRYIGSHPHS